MEWWGVLGLAIPVGILAINFSLKDRNKAESWKQAVLIVLDDITILFIAWMIWWAAWQK